MIANDSDGKRLMDSKSDNMEIMIGDSTAFQFISSQVSNMLRRVNER